MRTFYIECEDGSEWLVQHKAPSGAKNLLTKSKKVVVARCREVKDCMKPRIWGMCCESGLTNMPALPREVEKVEVEEIARVVRDALASYRCAEVWTEDGQGLPLVEVLTPKGDDEITRGMIEMGLLEDAILGAIRDALAAAPEKDEAGEVERMASTLARIIDWTIQHGAALKPTPGSADTFGDGMRAAKVQVRALLAAEAEKEKDEVEVGEEPTFDQALEIVLGKLVEWLL